MWMLVSTPHQIFLYAKKSYDVAHTITLQLGLLEFVISIGSFLSDSCDLVCKTSRY